LPRDFLFKLLLDFPQNRAKLSGRTP